jgi:hypothetical protein
VFQDISPPEPARKKTGMDIPLIKNIPGPPPSIKKRISCYF